MQQASEAVPVARVRRSLVIRHFAFSAAMWITYALYWRVVLGRGVEREARLAGILLGVFILLQLLLTQGWIAHNRRVERKHHTRRRLRPDAVPAKSEDFLGRSVGAFPEDADLTRVPVVVVRVEGGVKRFEAGLAFAEPRREQA
jgi:hypothetical protein